MLAGARRHENSARSGQDPLGEPAQLLSDCWMRSLPHYSLFVRLAPPLAGLFF